jgi:hypothetical protein
MQEIDRKDLVPGESYYILYLTYDEDNNMIRNTTIPLFIGTFKKLDEYPDIKYRELSRSFLFAFFENFREFKTKKYLSERDIFLNKLYKFYKANIINIEKEHERRTINMALQKITGDMWFHWY